MKMRKNNKRIFSAAVLCVCFLLVFLKGSGSASEHTHLFGEEIPVVYNGSYYVFKAVCGICGQEEYRYYDAAVTFIDDDGRADAMEHWERIVDQTGIRMTAALITGRITEKTRNKDYYCYTGWDTVERLKEKGVEFVSHTHNHQNMTEMSAEELEKDFADSQAALRAHGCRDDLLVFPFNACSEEALSVVRRYFSAGVGCGGRINKSPGDLYILNRIDLCDTKVMARHDFYGTSVRCYTIKTAELLQKHVKDALSVNGWLIFMCHAHNSPKGRFWFDENDEQTVVAFCRGVQDMGNVSFITLGEGVDLMRKYHDAAGSAEGHAHEWDTGRLTREPRCDREGQKTYTCVKCGSVITEAIPTTAHHPVIDAAVPAGCVADGKTEGSRCAVCGEVLTAQKVVPAPGHSFGKWQVTKPASPAEDGVETRVCVVCGATETRTIPGEGSDKPRAGARGDVDGDGEITSGDARLALRASVRLEPYEAGSAPFLAADVDGSGAIEASDARAILRVSVKLESFS